MKQTDLLDELLREWKPSEPNVALDQRVIAAYRSAVRRQRVSSRAWQRFWTMRVSIPIPALVVAALTIFALLFWLRPPRAPLLLGDTPGVVTRLNANGFQPLTDGEARVIPAVEVQ